MAKIRIPLDVEDFLKQDFVDRLATHYGFDNEKKVKINTVLQQLMHFVIFADELELTNILNRGRLERNNYSMYLMHYEHAENEGLLDGLDLKRGNPRKAEVLYYLMQFAIRPESRDEVRQKLEEIDNKIKSKEIFNEDCEDYMDKSAKILKTYRNYNKGIIDIS